MHSKRRCNFVTSWAAKSIVLCAGPASAGQTIREALAKGADRGSKFMWRLDRRQRPMDALSPRLGLLASSHHSPNLPISCPDRICSLTTSGYGQTGVVLAELLGFAHATIVMEVEPQDW